MKEYSKKNKLGLVIAGLVAVSAAPIVQAGVYIAPEKETLNGITIHPDVSDVLLDQDAKNALNSAKVIQPITQLSTPKIADVDPESVAESVAKSAEVEAASTSPLPTGIAMPMTGPVTNPAPEVAAEKEAKPEVSPFSFVATESFGRAMPLDIAIQQIMPQDGGCWKVNKQDGIGNTEVDWDGGNTWDQVLKGMSNKNTDLSVAINEADCVVGIGLNAKLAEALAKPVPEVWYLNPSKTLRQNITEWATRSGWSVEWKASTNYKFSNGAYLTGPFIGKGGALHQTLIAFKAHEKPLMAEFNEDATGNKVLVINDFKKRLKTVDESDVDRMNEFRKQAEEAAKKAKEEAEKKTEEATRTRDVTISVRRDDSFSNIIDR